ncbi:RNA polymerase sigma factor [Paenibacillus alkalitolerans]|uniref:RNA polymerase sigma factor n=1 Tax=Paenibacillus alkalitolerans TaxID=2799335 RepID=UPI0018F5CAC4|nr:RNA polymerase sigma factor [Paenibacillus alkalitolerans]
MDRKTAVSDLYGAHRAFLHNYLMKLTCNRDEAADLVQDIFVRLCQQNSLPECPKSWLFKTGYRLFIDRLRRKRRVVLIPLDHSIPSGATPEQEAIDNEFDLLVRSSLRRLHPQTRTALYLRIFEQSTYGEIAELLGCPENTVKSYIRRGRFQLSKSLTNRQIR